MKLNDRINPSILCALAFCLLFSCILLTAPQTARAQNITAETLNTKEAKRNREMGLAMLGEMKKILEEYYYDPHYHGIDLKARFKVAEDRIKTLNYNWQVLRVLAQVLLDFNDSHTSFIPPPRTDYFQYGFSFQMIGEKCFVTNVKKGSDAEKRGLSVGDQVLAIGKYSPTRDNLWKIMYLLYRLDPVNTVDLKIKNLSGEEKQLTVTARTMTEKEYKEERKKHKDDEAAKPFKCQEISLEVIACKLYTFMADKGQIDKMMKQVNQHSKFILDLRGNGGGLVSTDEYLIGYLFDHDVKIADVVTRQKTEIHMAHNKGDKAFKGELVVLIDSKSASASEVLARVVQLERRGKIIGDVSRGAVMTSITQGLFGKLSGFEYAAITYTGMSVTIADLIMKDGSRIEGVGVIPDEAIGPTGFALAHGSDPILSYAATKLGAKLTPEQAGQFYFITEKPEGEGEQSETEDNK